jgi:hypothetical protein
MAVTNAQPNSTIEAFHLHLQETALVGTCGLERAFFYPSALLQAYIRSNIEDLLQAVAPDQEHCAKDIVDSYFQVFAILLSIREGAFISHFTRNEMSNDRLPFIDRGSFPLEHDFFDKFQEKQWMFCARPLTHLLDRNYPECRILPFHLEETTVATGNSGVIYKINIPVEYDQLYDSPVPEQVSHQFFAL